MIINSTATVAVQMNKKGISSWKKSRDGGYLGVMCTIKEAQNVTYTGSDVSEFMVGVGAEIRFQSDAFEMMMMEAEEYKGSFLVIATLSTEPRVGTITTRDGIEKQAVTLFVEEVVKVLAAPGVQPIAFESEDAKRNYFANMQKQAQATQANDLAAARQRAVAAQATAVAEEAVDLAAVL